MRKRRLLIICLFFILFIFNTSIINASVPDTVLKQKDAVVTILIYENDKPLAYGSGFIINSNGIVATNYHVISLLFEKQEASMAIKMANGEFIKAQKLLSINEEKDIALIQVENKGLPSVRLAKDYKPKQGDEVFVIGSPYGLETTVSNGIISSIRGEDEFLQITAPISGGSSGSPVFNANGEVTGIATLIIQGGQNLNFAIPIKYITEVKNSIQTKKTEALKTTIPSPAVEPIMESKVKSVDEHIKLAKEYYINGQWNEAFEEYKNAISERPSNPFLYFAQAKAALRAVRYSVPTAEQTEETRENENIEKEKANIYDLAIENYSKAIALQPDNVVFYHARALTYYSREEYENAVKDLDKAIFLEPNISFLYEDRCRAKNELKLYQDAIDDCTKAINLKPNMQHYFLLFLSPFKEVGFSEEELKKGIGYPVEKTNLGSFYLTRASIYQKIGNIDEQIKDKEKYVMIYPEYSSGLYILYQKEGRLDENALKFYNHAINVYPREGSLYDNRGDIYRKLKKYDKALKDYTRAIELCPKCATYYWSRAILYEYLEQYDKAIKDYTTVIARDPQLGKVIYKARGEIYLAKKEKQKALRDYMKSCELSDEEACSQVKTIQKDINRGDKWVKFFEGGGGRTFYYDKTSIKQQSKKYMMVWTRFEADDVAAYVQERKNNDLPIKGYENFSHNLTSHRIECSSEQIGLISAVVYDTNDRVINSYTGESKIMEPIVPDSMGASLLKTVCDKKKK